MREIPTSTGLRSKVDRVLGLREAVETRLLDTREEVKSLGNEEELLSLVSELFRQLIDEEITSGVKALEELQSEGLRTVFHDQDLAVSAEVKTQRGKVSVNLMTVQKLDDETTITGLSNDAFGGAVTTVQSVLMRIIVVLRRGLRPLLILDESLPAFDNDYVYSMGSFLSQVCSRLGLDILLVTHNPALMETGDRTYRIVKTGDGVRFEVIQ